MLTPNSKVSFSMGFLLAVVGAVATAGALYTSINYKIDALTQQVSALTGSLQATQQSVKNIEYEQYKSGVQYNYDMNKYIREHPDKNR